jgi:quercetin dioxygenase-like cupin family protein
MMRRSVVTAIVGALSLASVWSAALQVDAKSSAFSDVTVKTLAQGQVKALPAGKIFINFLEFSQLPGADFGPPARLAATVYTLHGTSTISFPGAASVAVGPGEAAFVPVLAGHTVQNLEGRIGAGAIAGGLIVLVIVLCTATWMRGRARAVTIAMLSLLLIGGGALPLIGATSNDYYLIAVRPEAQRQQPMPRPDGRVAYSSPDVDPVPAGPYVETLSAITVPTGAIYDAPSAPGPEMIIVTEGSAAVHIGDQTTQLSGSGAAFAQAGQTVAIGNQGSGTLKLLEFVVAGGPAS